MLITADLLTKILTETVHTKHGPIQRSPVSAGKLKMLEIPINAMLLEFSIDTNYRIAAFLANAIIESDHLRTFEEYASGQEYEGRTDLGNTEAGDGKRFKGRGIIQVTGRSNYQACGDYFSVDFTSAKGRPELLSSDVGMALRSGGWFWTVHIKQNLNTYADMGPGGFAETVYRVNGAVTAKRTHWPERVKYYERALVTLGADDPGEVSSDISKFHPKHRRKRHGGAHHHGRHKK